MARVTVEDCLEFVDNRFDLVLKATNRARALELGASDPMVPLDNDKPTVLALREIAMGYDITAGKKPEQAEESDVMFAADMMQQPEVIRPEEPSSAAEFFRSSFGAPISSDSSEPAEDPTITNPFSRFISGLDHTDSGDSHEPSVADTPADESNTSASDDNPFKNDDKDGSSI